MPADRSGWAVLAGALAALLVFTFYQWWRLHQAALELLARPAALEPQACECRCKCEVEIFEPLPERP